MKSYTLNLTDEQIKYVMTAICDKNLKHAIRLYRAKREGDDDAKAYQQEMHDTGNKVLSMISSVLYGNK